MRKTAAIAIVVILYHLFFYPVYFPIPGHLDFLLFEVISFAFMWTVLWHREWGRQAKYAASATLMGLFCALLALLTANPVSHFFLGITSLTMTTLTAYMLSLTTAKFGSVFEVIAMPLRIAGAWLSQFVEQAPNGIAKLDSAKPLFSHDISIRIIRGLVIAVPIVLIIGGLLAAADPIFGQLITRYLNLNLPQELVPRIMMTLLLLFALIPFSGIVIKKRYSSPAASLMLSRYSVEMMTVVSLVSIILGIFLLVQFRYLFASVPETQLHQYGVSTYSEYVRRGFMVLLFVTFITYSVCGLAYSVYRVQNHQLLKNTTFVLLGELVIFIISIMRRIYLYQLHHGFTRIRIYGLAFVVYVLGLVVMLGLRSSLKSKRPWYLYEYGLGILLIIAVTLIRPDVLMVNRYPPTVNNEIDYVYISRLSTDALLGWISAYKHAESVLASAPDPASTPSADAVRPILYASFSVDQLWRSYMELTRTYGTLAEFQIVSGSSAPEVDMRQFRRKDRWLDMNLAERSVYPQLVQSIKPSDINQLLGSFNSYLNKLSPELRYMPLDRSYDSPLL